MLHGGWLALSLILLTLQQCSSESSRCCVSCKHLLIMPMGHGVHGSSITDTACVGRLSIAHQSSSKLLTTHALALSTSNLTCCSLNVDASKHRKINAIALQQYILS